ncbi:CocE/NonD family hydrolase [Streptomyces griseofuscus]|uniref:CocE/NonD family hydrolase n=1 Tax=Streptomyces griseofuscus TaxID=146922 RepID=UPI0036C3C9FE
MRDGVTLRLNLFRPAIDGPFPVLREGLCAEAKARQSEDTCDGGHSEGRGELLSDQEADDISEVIAWAAAQPWSTGRVGMLGVSYLAMSQYKVAALNPPAVKAICPRSPPPVADHDSDSGVRQLLRQQSPQRGINARLPAGRVHRPARVRAPRTQVGLR